MNNSNIQKVSLNYNDINNKLTISNVDLYQNQFDECVLIDNIDKLSPHSILITQKNLSNEFITNYVLDPKYAIFREDYDITLPEILKYHPNFAKYKFKKQ